MPVVGAGGVMRKAARDPGSDGRGNGGEVIMRQEFPPRGDNRVGYQGVSAKDLRGGKGTIVSAPKSMGVSNY